MLRKEVLKRLYWELFMLPSEFRLVPWPQLYRGKQVALTPLFRKR